MSEQESTDPDLQPGKVKKGFTAAAATLAALAGPGAGAAAAGDAPVHPETQSAITPNGLPLGGAAFGPPTIETVKYKVGEKWPEKFAQGPEAGVPRNPDPIPGIAKDASERAVNLLDGRIASIKISGGASAEGNTLTADLNQPNARNKELADVRAHKGAVELLAALDATQVAHPDHAEFGPATEDSLDDADIKNIQDLAVEHGYDTDYVRMIADYNRETREREASRLAESAQGQMPVEITKILNKLLRDKRKDVVDITIQGEPRTVDVPPAATSSAAPHKGHHEYSPLGLPVVLTEVIAANPYPNGPDTKPHQGRGKTKVSDHDPTTARTHKQPLPGNYTPNRNRPEQPGQKSGQMGRSGRQRSK